jgi:hypothetical protein
MISEGLLEKYGFIGRLAIVHSEFLFRGKLFRWHGRIGAAHARTNNFIGEKS